MPRTPHRLPGWRRRARIDRMADLIGERDGRLRRRSERRVRCRVTGIGLERIAASSPEPSSCYPLDHDLTLAGSGVPGQSHADEVMHSWEIEPTEVREA